MEFLSVINSLGTVPFLALLVIIFIMLFREVKADNARTQKHMKEYEEKFDRRFTKHEEAIAEDIAEHKAATEKMVDSLREVDKELEKRIRVIETEYAPRTYVQEVVSGWRNEIRNLNDKLDKVLKG